MHSLPAGLAVKLLTQVGANDPIEIGTMHVPLEISSTGKGRTVDLNVRPNLATAFRTAADHLDPPDAPVDPAEN